MDAERNGPCVAFVLLPYALLVVVLVDCARIPWSRLSELAPRAVALTASHALPELAPFLALLLTIVAAGAVCARWPARRAVARAVIAAAALATAALSYAELVGYHRFAGHIPFAIGWTVLAIYLVWAHLLVCTPFGPAWQYPAAGAIGLAGTVAAMAFSATQFRGQYPTLHSSLMSAGFLTGHVGAVCLSLHFVPIRRWRWAAPSFLVIGFAAVVGHISSERSPAAALVREHTVAGQASALSTGLPTPEVCDAPPAMLDTDAALAVFDERSGLPQLPASFRLLDFHVLFVATEATRYDETSLDGGDRTPALQELVRAGAFSFSRSHAPSSRTLLSVSSLFSSTFPSHAAIVTRVPTYAGELLGDEVTPAELFRDAGYATFAHVHDRPLRYEMPGLYQGFDSVVEHQSWGDARRKADGAIVARTLDTAVAHHNAGERFFGWVFLIGPHKPYAGDSGANAPARERYRGDIARADRALGELVAGLRRAGVLDNTIVVFTSDHGEEFGEHGRTGSHGTTLYSEVTHVPLVIWLPGVAGVRVESPTSLVYLAPWLLLRGDENMRALAERKIRDDLAPMMIATDGAVVTELIEAYRMKSALVYDDYKVTYDYFSRLFELFDLRLDPAEQHDLYSAGGPVAARYRERMMRYRAVRACRERVRVTEEVATKKRRGR